MTDPLAPARTRPGDPTVDALASVRRALLDDARRQAAAVIEAARADGDERRCAAHRDAEEAVARARRRAELTAAARADREVAVARREAHTILLATDAAIWDELAGRVRRAVTEMPDDPRYSALVDALEQLARRQLGAEAMLDRCPDGGITAAVGDRSVDYRLGALADRVLDLIADDVEASR